MSEFYGDEPSSPEMEDETQFNFNVMQEKVKNVLKYIEVLSTEYEVTRKLSLSEPISFADYLKDNLEKSTAEEYLQILSKCNCCEEHIKRRPVNLEDNSEYSEFGYKETGKKSCKCNCRHSARWLYRAFSGKEYFI